MSEALERVIAQQQAEIDSLKRTIEACNKAEQKRHDRETAFYKRVDRMIDFKLRPYWKDDQKEAFQKYGALLHDVRIDMISHGWCLRCADWTSFCECNDE